MRDPWESRSAEGTIVTGAAPERIAPTFREILDAAVSALEVGRDGANTSDAALFVYGSVATGQAVRGRSDIDLLAVGVDADRATAASEALSERFADRCREVAIGTATVGDFAGEHDEAYGNRVFLRHYCVQLAGPAAHVPTDDFPADERAARGFNGDIARHRERWRSELSTSTDVGVLAKRVARKTLLAVAGLVSMHDETWTTDRAFAATRWAEIEPALANGLATLLEWTADAHAIGREELAGALDDVVDPMVHRFATDIGLWP